MNRKALVLYLRDLRDLEFARRKIAAIYESRMAANYGRTVAYFETARYLEGR